MTPTHLPPLPHREDPGTHFNHSAAERIRAVKYLKDTIGNKTRDISASSTVPEPTASLGTCQPIQKRKKWVLTKRYLKESLKSGLQQAECAVISTLVG
jgi:hypothetical protein